MDAADLAQTALIVAQPLVFGGIGEVQDRILVQWVRGDHRESLTGPQGLANANWAGHPERHLTAPAQPTGSPTAFGAVLQRSDQRSRPDRLVAVVRHLHPQTAVAMRRNSESDQGRLGPTLISYLPPVGPYGDDNPNERAERAERAD